MTVGSFPSSDCIMASWLFCGSKSRPTHVSREKDENQRAVKSELNTGQREREREGIVPGKCFTALQPSPGSQYLILSGVRANLAK